MSVEKQKIFLGSRGSELARAQTAMVVNALRGAWPELDVRIEMIKTRGDERGVESIDPRAGRKGIFTGEIERALAAGEIDIAVHSAKDLPSDATEGLEVFATLPRAAVDDVLIKKNPGGLGSLKRDAIVATGSVRRQHQLRWRRPDIQIVELRGNVPTRLRKLLNNEWDGIVLARAGIERLGHDFSSGSFVFEEMRFYAEILPRAEFLPAGGQGVIALQLRSDDEKAKAITACVNHPGTLLCLKAEREFLRLLQGDCNSPVGVLATMDGNGIRMRAQIFEPEVREPRAGEVEGTIAEGAERLAARLMEQINGQ
ncbi:MAG TPA: hydroxymethylbilane synthase [Chthoniobacterales bacterium]|nr:hydroxymethylbilane synthase [Chthoniobacterales bacterium]